MSPAVIAGAAAAGLSTGIVSGVAAGIKAMAVSALIGGVSHAMQRRDQHDTTQAMGQTIKDPVAPRRVIYGQRRVSGTLVHLSTTNDDKLIHMIVAMAGHEVQHIGDIWLNDNPVEHYAKYGRKPWRIVEWMGRYGPIDLADLSVTVNGQTHTGTMETLLTELSARGFIVSGDAGNYEIGGDSGTYQKQATLEITVNGLDDILNVSDTNGIVRDRIADDMPVIVRTGYGTPDQAAHPDIISELPEWTEAHRLQGIAWVYVRLRYDYRAFPAGLPAVTAIVRGKQDIYDPRSDSYTYTTNPALCVADYLHNSKYGLGAAYGAEININALIAAANVCDELVTKADGSFETRYTCNGVLSAATDPKRNIEALLSSMAGTAVYTGGLWTIRPGAWEPPTITLNESHLRGPLRMQTRPSRSDLSNGVKGVFADPDQDYQPTDFPAVSAAEYVAEDGERIWQDIMLDYTTSASQAQRIAKITLQQSRRGITLHYPCSIAALGLTAGSTVAIDNSRYGWSQKTFRVVGWEQAIDADGLLGVDLQLRETDAQVYNWDDGEESPTLPPVQINQPRPWYVAPVTGLTATLSDQTTEGGRLIPAILVNFSASTTPADHYRVELWLADSDTLLASQEIRDTATAFTGVSGGVLYRVRVVAVNRLGAESMASVAFVGVTEEQAAMPISYMALSIYTRSATPPPTPTGGSYNFDTHTITPPDGWYLDIPADSDDGVYESKATAEAPGGTGTDTTLEWSAPRASAGALLQVLSNEIREGQLHESLSAPIERISMGWIDDDILLARIREWGNITLRTGSDILDNLETGARIDNEQTLREAGDSALAQNITTVSAKVDTNTAAIQTEQTARADGDSALASNIATVQTTVNGLSAAVQTKAEVSDLGAVYEVKLDVNGRVVGFGLVAGSTSSEFGIRADKFWISDPDDTTGANPFIVSGGATYIKKALIKEADIDSLKIAGNAVTVPKKSPDLTASSVTINGATTMTSSGSTLIGVIVADGPSPATSINNLILVSGRTGISNTSDDLTDLEKGYRVGIFVGTSLLFETGWIPLISPGFGFQFLHEDQTAGTAYTLRICMRNIDSGATRTAVGHLTVLGAKR